jgi:glutaredoxin 3
LKAKYIKLYSTRTCPYCMMEKAWLEDEKIQHEVVYVDSNREEAQKMVDKTQQMGVPVTEIGFDDGKEEYVIGFDKPRLSQILGI